MRSFLPLAILALSLSACHVNSLALPGNEADASDNAVATPLQPGARPVQIGEDGANFDACGSTGIVSLNDGSTADVRAAPFEDADKLGSLGPGRKLFICDHSIDQRWLGIVVPPAAQYGDAAGRHCGVTRQVDHPQAYDGPCLSGWVANAAVRLDAG